MASLCHLFVIASRKYFFFCAILYIFGIIQIILLVYCWGHIDGNPMWPKWESYVAEMGILCGRDGNPMWPKMGI